jgi:hypothetical protein
MAANSFSRSWRRKTLAPPHAISDPGDPRYDPRSLRSNVHWLSANRSDQLASSQTLKVTAIYGMKGCSKGLEYSSTQRKLPCSWKRPFIRISYLG